MRLSVGGIDFIRGLTGGNGVLSKAMVAETLEADEFTFTLMATKDFEPLLDVNDVEIHTVNDLQVYVLSGSSTVIDPTVFQRGETASLYDDEDNVIMNLYVDRIERISKTQYNLHCISAVGLAASITNNGGMYANAGFASVLKDIMNAAIIQSTDDYWIYWSRYGWSYRVSKELSSLQVSGHLPIASVRDNLRDLLFPYGVSLVKELTGMLTFKYVYAESATPVPIQSEYTGGVVPSSDNVTDVTVYEHEYIADASIDPVVLADYSGESVTSRKVVFNGPHHTLTTSGTLTIDNSGSDCNCNYATVTGTGILYGIPYVHVTTSRSASTGISGTKKEARVKDMTMVNSLNGLNTLNRLVNYYANAQYITTAFKLNWYHDANTDSPHVKAGDFITIAHPYTKEETSAFVKSLDVTLSAIAKGKASLVANWVPKYLGNNYSAYTLFTQDATFTVPPGITMLRVTLGGGGQGGHGGTTAPGYSWSYFGGDQGDLLGSGAPGGESGDPGKTYTVEIPVSPGDVVTISIGEGGAGGTAGAAGSLGGDTTITINGTTYSSASGNVKDTGVMNPLTGAVYATKGVSGTAGSNGGNAGLGNYGEDYVLDGTTYTGGQGINGGYSTYWGDTISAAGGGGAAYKSNGPSATIQNAGAGATPAAADDSTALSGGGNGGHGGGGHGMRMQLHQTYYDGQGNPFDVWEGIAVGGGTGGVGGKGGKGFALFIY